MTATMHATLRVFARIPCRNLREGFERAAESAHRLEQRSAELARLTDAELTARTCGDTGTRAELIESIARSEVGNALCAEWMEAEMDEEVRW